jgi:hypothetical protein
MHPTLARRKAMSMNSEVIRHVYDAFAKGDVPTVLAPLDPNVRWTEAEAFPYGGTYTGPDAVLTNVILKLGTEWKGFAAAPHAFVSEGKTVVALGQYRGTFKATGKSFTAPFAHVWELQGGKVVGFQQYTDTAVVRRALQ